jgi:hypothetical protein
MKLRSINLLRRRFDQVPQCCSVQQRDGLDRRESPDNVEHHREHLKGGGTGKKVRYQTCKIEE